MAEQGLIDLRCRRNARLHLDIDSTVEPLFGTQQGALPGPNPHYHGRPSYHPLLAAVAETGTVIGAELRPGDTGFGDDQADFVGRCIDRLRARHRSAILCVRIDAAGDCAALMKAIAKRDAYFFIKGKMERALCESDHPALALADRRCGRSWPCRHAGRRDRLHARLVDRGRPLRARHRSPHARAHERSADRALGWLGLDHPGLSHQRPVHRPCRRALRIQRPRRASSRSSPSSSRPGPSARSRAKPSWPITRCFCSSCSRTICCDASCFRPACPISKPGVRVGSAASCSVSRAVFCEVAGAGACDSRPRRLYCA